jgi:hypothetical protein
VTGSRKKCHGFFNNPCNFIDQHASRKLFILILLTAWLLITSASATECNSNSCFGSVIDSYTWTTGSSLPEGLVENLTMNTTIEYYKKIRGGYTSSDTSYVQSAAIIAASFVQQTDEKQQALPVDRILRSSLKITNLSENLRYFVTISSKYYEPGGPGEMESPPSDRGCGCWYYGDGTSSLRGICDRPYGPWEELKQSIYRSFGHTQYKDCLQPLSSKIGYDHRHGFPGMAVNSSFILMDGEIITDPIIKNGPRIKKVEYPGTNPIHFTSIYTVDYCENDLILGYCPGGIHRAIQTIEFGRDALPPDIRELNSTDYLFVVKNATHVGGVAV